MKQFSGGELSPQQEVLNTTTVNSVIEPMYIDTPEIYMSAEDLARRLQIEELASGNEGKGFVIIFDSPNY